MDLSVDLPALVTALVTALSNCPLLCLTPTRIQAQWLDGTHGPDYDRVLPMHRQAGEGGRKCTDHHCDLCPVQEGPLVREEDFAGDRVLETTRIIMGIRHEEEQYQGSFYKEWVRS